MSCLWYELFCRLHTVHVGQTEDTSCAIVDDLCTHTLHIRRTCSLEKKRRFADNTERGFETSVPIHELNWMRSRAHTTHIHTMPCLKAHGNAADPIVAPSWAQLDLGVKGTNPFPFVRKLLALPQVDYFHHLDPTLKHPILVQHLCWMEKV